MALFSLQKMQGSLMSFRILTEEAKGKISKQRLKEIGNTDWETQHLGFTNMPRSIEGALRKQDYLIKELCYQLAKEKFKQKAIDEKELLEKKGRLSRQRGHFKPSGITLGLQIDSSTAANPSFRMGAKELLSINPELSVWAEDKSLP